MIRYFTLLLIVICTTIQLKSAVFGGEMAYSHLSGNKYIIKVILYRNCKSTALSVPTDYGYFAGKNGNGGCGAAKRKLTRISIQDVSIRCKGAGFPCTPVNSLSSNEGIEKHVMVDTVDFGSVPFSNFSSNSNCCNISFYVKVCCRLSGINTGAGENFTLTCAINLCNLKKCSNKISNSPEIKSIPPRGICINKPFFYNYQAIDSFDNDKIVYHLIPGLKDTPQVSISYISPFTYKIPLTPTCVPSGSLTCSPQINSIPTRGFYFDTASGQLVFTPSKASELGHIAVELIEYRKDTSGNFIPIGRVMRDMSLLILDNCNSNNNPIVSNNIIQTVVEGDKLTFQISSLDSLSTPNQTVRDTIKLSWVAPIRNASIKVTDTTKREKSLDFVWQTKTGDAREYPYDLFIQATDQFCEPAGMASKSFRIFVKKLSSATFTIQKLPCSSLNLKATANSQIRGPIAYSWQIIDAATNTVELTGSASTVNTGPLKSGKKYILLDLTNDFYHVNTVKDSVSISEHPSIFIGNDTSMCKGSSLSVKSTTKLAKSPIIYQWTQGFSFGAGDSNSTYVVQNIASLVNLKVRGVDADGCIMLDQLQIKPLNLPIAIWTKDTLDALCYAQSKILLGPYFNNGSSNNTLIWDNSSLVSDLGGGIFQFDGTKLNNNTLQSSFNFTKVFGRFTDSNGCNGYDTTVIIVKPTPILDLKKDSFCQDLGKVTLLDVVKLPAPGTLNTDYNQNWKIITGPIGINTTGLIYNQVSPPLQDWRFTFGNKNEDNYSGNYTISLSISNKITGCYNTDTTLVTIIAEPKITKVGQPKFCESSQAIDLLNFILVNGIAPSGGQYMILAYNSNLNDPHVNDSNVINNRYLKKSANSGIWNLRYSVDNLGCMALDTFNVVVAPKPQVIFTLTPDRVAPKSLPEFQTHNSTTISDMTNLSYFWNAGTGKSQDNSSASDYTIVYPPLDNVYTITLTAASNYNCKDSFKKKVTVGDLSSTTYLNLNDIGIYFNSKLQAISKKVRVHSIRWYDQSGKLIFEDRTNSGFDLPPGIYFYNLKYNNGTSKLHEIRGKWYVLE